MNTFRFRFNNGKKSLTIMIWFFTAVLTVAVTAATIVLLSDPDPLFPAWLLLISTPLIFTAIYRLFKAVSERRSTEIVSLSKNGFTSSCFGSVLFSEIYAIQVPVREIDLLGAKVFDYYQKTDTDLPHLEFSITMRNGNVLKWILNEWGGIFNSKEEFTIFFSFLTALTDELHQLYHTNEPYNSYLKILDEEGLWQLKTDKKQNVS